MSFTLSISLHQPHFYLLHHYAFGPPRNGSFHADNIFLAKSTYKNTFIKLHEFNRDLSKIICQKKIYLLKNRPSFAPFGCNGLCSILLPTLGITFFFLGCRYHGPPFLNISSAFRNSKKKITQTHGILGIATVPSKGHHYVIMYTIYKSMVGSHFMCPVLRYPLIAKPIGSTAQNRVTRMSPREELGWLLPWWQWERDQIFRASVTFFWVLLAFDTEHRNAGTSTKSSITDLLCLAKKPSVGISPVVPKVTEMDMVRSGWAHEQHAGES